MRNEDTQLTRELDALYATVRRVVRANTWDRVLIAGATAFDVKAMNSLLNAIANQGGPRGVSTHHDANGNHRFMFDSEGPYSAGQWRDPSSELEGYWRLNEAAGGIRYDAHHDNDVYEQASVPITTGLVYESAADPSNGTNQYFRREGYQSGRLAFGDEDFTVACWLRANSGGLAGGLGFVFKGNTSAPADAFEYGLQYDPGPGRFVFRVSNGTTTGTVQAAFAETVLQWYLLIGWHDSVANTINVQAFGGLGAGTVFSFAYSSGCWLGGHPFCIGGGGLGAGINNGRIGPAMVWRRVLTDAERTSLYNAGVGVTYENLNTSLLVGAGLGAVNGGVFTRR